MKQNHHQFMRAMLFIAVLFSCFLGVAASETDLPQTNKPTIYANEGVGKYTVNISYGVGSDAYYRVDSGEWYRCKGPIVFDEPGSYLIEAYAISFEHSPSNIASLTIVVNEHTGENLVDPDADDPSIIFHDGFKYKINGSTVSLTRQTDNMCNGDLVIPPSITYNGETYPVTEIESWACYSTHNVKSVQIPSTVTEIGLYAFNSCSRLRSIDVDPDNPNYCDIDGVLYNKAGTYLYSYPNARSTEYTIPDGVTMIYYSAFQEDFDLESVTIPNSVTSIRSSAFSCCYSLQSVVLPSNLRVFDASSFRSCRELKSVTFPSTISKIPEWAFSNCYSLESVAIPGTIKTIAYGAFEECTALSSVTISEGVFTIQGTAFSRCRSIPEITIPSTVSSIEETAFYRCTSLTAFHVDPSNTHYCDVDGVLYNKNKTTLLAYALGHPRTSYDILSTTQAIGKQAFDTSKSLEHINIPSGVTTMGESTFGYCKKLISISLPAGMTRIPSGLVIGCENLTEITIPAGITNIGSNSLRNTSLMIVNCLAETPPTLDGSYSIDTNTYRNGTLCVPSSSIEAYRSAEGWSNFVTIMGITAGDADGDGVLTISDVTTMIDYLLGGNIGSCFSVNADSNGDGVVNISDVTALIDMLLNGNGN